MLMCLVVKLAVLVVNVMLKLSFFFFVMLTCVLFFFLLTAVYTHGSKMLLCRVEWWSLVTRFLFLVTRVLFLGGVLFLV